MENCTRVDNERLMCNKHVSQKRNEALDNWKWYKFYSLLCCNSNCLQIRLKYTYSVVSVKLDWQFCTSKKWTSACPGHISPGDPNEWGAVCDRNLSHWISEKGPGRGWGLSEEMIFFSECLCHKPWICSSSIFVQSHRGFHFLVVSSPHNRQLGTHIVKGRPEAPGSKVLPLWTLNLSVYAHTCRQTKEV